MRLWLALILCFTMIPCAFSEIMVIPVSERNFEFNTVFEFQSTGNNLTRLDSNVSSDSIYRVDTTVYIENIILSVRYFGGSDNFNIYVQDGEADTLININIQSARSFFDVSTASSKQALASTNSIFRFISTGSATDGTHVIYISFKRFHKFEKGFRLGLANKASGSQLRLFGRYIEYAYK